MALVKCSDYMERDSRLRCWGKRVVAGDVDLSKMGGYALGGVFVKWDDTVSLSEGQYLVVAAERGSRKNHEYHYAMIDGDHSVDVWPAIQAALEEERITEAEYAKAKNSVLYAYAVWVSLQAKHSPLAGFPDGALVEELLSRGYQVEKV